MASFVKKYPTKAVLVLIILIGIASTLMVYYVFSASSQSFEYCDSGGKIYKELEKNHTEWLDHFSRAQASFQVQITSHPTAVFSTTTPTNTVIVIVEVDPGTGIRRPREQTGYFFTPNGELPNFFSVYGYGHQKFEIEALGDSIYCYRMD